MSKEQRLGNNNDNPVPGSESVSRKGITLSDETWIELKRTSASLEEMERKIEKLQKVYNQGVGQQKGFLTSSQVKMVLEMLDEIEEAYSKHYTKLESLQKEYDARQQQMHEKILKSQELLTYAEGGADGMGDRLPEEEVERRRRRRDALIEEMERFKENARPDLEAIETNLNILSQSAEHSRRIYNEDIGSLHEQTPAQKHIENAVMTTVNYSGLMLSMGSLLRYVSSGYSNLTQQQWGASDLGQKLGFYEGDDKELRKDLTKIGRESGYDTQSTLEVGRSLARGGVTDKEGFEKDIQTAQEMGRAFSIDPTQMSDIGALMKQMNALEDGQMQRLANLIGNSVNKSGMQGREEEQLKATQQVVKTATSNLSEVDFSQVQHLINLQDLLAESSPKLKGEGGAQALQSVDSAIKNGGNMMDILLGYGTNPDYQGIGGRHKLEYLKEEGISNPETFSAIIRNAEKMSADNEYQEMLIKQATGLNLHDIKALKDSGAYQKIRDGEMLNEDMLDAMDKEGSEHLKELGDTYKNSFSSKTRGNRIDKENLGTSMAEPVQGIWENAKDIWHDQPTLLKGAELIGAGIIGAPVINKLTKGALNNAFKMSGNILRRHGARGGAEDVIDDVAENSTSAFDDIIKGAQDAFARVKEFGANHSGKGADYINKGAEYASKGATKAKDTVKGAIKYAEEGASTLDDILGGATKGITSALDETGNATLSTIGKSVGKLGSKAIPIAGIALDAGLNMAQGDSVGKSITKAGLGGALALGAGALLAPVTGGLSVGAGLALAGGVGIGSSVIADTAVDAIWKEDTKEDSTKNTSKESPVEKTRKDSSKYKKVSQEIDENLSSVEGTYTVNVKISGNIDGMTTRNQTEITNSVSDFFNGLLGKNTHRGIDLSRSWSRG